MINLFSRSDRPRALRALCYGKLPFAKDFLASRGGEAGRRFQAWLGVLDRGGRAAVLPRPQRVLFAPPDLQEEYVIGTVWDSADAGEIRKFPFALFYEPRRTRLERQLTSRVFFGLEQWESLEREYAVLSRLSRTDDFYRQLRGIRHSDAGGANEAGRPADRFAREAGRYSPSDLADAIYGADALAGWTELLWRIERAIFAGRRASGTVLPPAMRLPLAESIPFALQVEAWLEFIRSRVDGASPIPSLIFPAPRADEGEVGPATFSVFFRSIRESDVELLRESVGDADIMDLAAPDPEAKGEDRGAFAAAVAESLSNAEADLSRLLPRRVGGAGGQGS